MKRINPTYIILAVVLIGVGAVALPRMLGDQVGSRSVDGDRITEVVSEAEADARTTVGIQLVEGDAEHEADHIFGTLAGVQGVEEATLDAAALELEVAFDSSMTDEGTIRQRLIESGYVAPTMDDATPMEVAEDGSVQRITIRDVGRFDPFLITAEAGVPIEIEFEPGQDCRTSIAMPDLGIEADISEGATVEVPALQPGSYAILCGEGESEAGIIVR